jgi:hypothetical protein
MTGPGLVRAAAAQLAFCSLLSVTSCSVAEQADRANISAYGLKAIGVPQQLAVSLQEHLESNLLKYSQYSVVSRSDIDLILSENRFQQTGACHDEECLVAAGNLLGIEKMVTGTVSRLGHTYNLVLKLINVGSAQLEASANGRHGGSEDQLLDLSEQLLDELLHEEEQIVEVEAVEEEQPVEEEQAVEQEQHVVHEIVVMDTLAPAEADSPVVTLSPGKEDVIAHKDEPGKAAAQDSQPSRLAKRIGRGALVILGALAIAILTFNLIGS